MKSLTIFIHTGDQQDMTNLLHGIEQVHGFTMARVEGHGAIPEQDAFLAARDKVVGSIPHVRVDIVLEDEDVDETLALIRQATNGGGLAGAYYFVAPVEQEGRL